MSSRKSITPATPRLSRKPLVAALATLLAGSAMSAMTQAQEQPQRRGSAALLEEVVVTARKREEGSQDVPLSITAFGADQIEALKVRDLTSLSVGMPNVALDDVGTTRGTANFSIRGLGISASIPSIDPTVGVFVNGVYLGVNNGIIFDVFDLESIEVLRGPQGVLFGRNVTGGAILMNTKKPGEEFEGQARFAVDGGGDGGLNYYAMGTIGGPVTDNLGLKLTAYYNEDEGYFRREAFEPNGVTAEDVGAVEQTMIRPTLVWTPTDMSELVVRYEYTDISGDGAVAQSHTNGRGEPGAFVNFDRESFGNSNDFIGYQNIETDFLTVEYNQGVSFGDGTVTAIYGWRDSYSESGSDIDGQPVWAFHSAAWLETEQDSLELRYNGQFGDFNVTTGAYWFENNLGYHERRNLAGAPVGNLAPAVIQDGGGLYGVETLGVFAAADYDITDRLTLTAGLRYTDEEKYGDIASLAANQSAGIGFDPEGNPTYAFDFRCNLVDSSEGFEVCPFDFNGKDDWQTWSPKVGASYALTDEAQIYGHWSRGFRSGGYNLRNTTPLFTPEAFDEEQVDNFELGYKSQQSWGRLNAAFFYTQVEDMQREINFADPDAGVVQIIRNSADATLWGVELDGTFALSDNLLMMASFGYIDASYDDVFFDLNGDGVIDGADKALGLPRAPEVTYSLGFNYDMELGSWGYATARINYAYRDEVFFTDNNLGFINEQDILDAGLDVYSNDGNWVFSLYGRNMLDTVKHGGDTQLSPTLAGVPTGGTFSPLMRGQTYGAEVTFNF
ncbi:TonB-dependent receptor [Congregibacter sp.]|uniref:TonB-dependent receptor n=1 Tax=Congregibacter sp. TaxID=2744308 RepID=UPI00385F00EE